MDDSVPASQSPDMRSMTVIQIEETLARCNLADGGKNGMDELLINARHVEEEIFDAATDETDYLRKLSLEMRSLESKQQHRLIQQQVSIAKTLEGCLEALDKMPSRKFNNEQCEYLVDKLKMVIQSANALFAGIHAEAHRSRSNLHFRSKTSLKRLAALAIQIKSFVEGCCEDAWLPVAMILTNMTEHVSSIGFDLELCRLALCKEPGRLTRDQVLDINKAEFEIVRKKAASDVETLLARVRSEQSSFSGGKKDLTSYLLQRLSRVQANGASFTAGSSLGADTHEESLWTRLFEWVRPAERLGKGSAATVHKATWLGIQVAKKTFMGHENPDFMKEVGILGKLWHPNITSMFCCAKDSGKRWCAIIMELMDGDLHDLMLQRCCNTPWPFSILEGVDIMHQIGEGVKYLHDQKIVHRDLKSFNILVKVVEDKGSKIEHVHAKVADFGLSKTKESSIRYSTQTFNTGTNRWMAPEIIRLNGGEEGSTTKPKYPFKCDVYSYAMVCYEILTGYEPFYEERSLSKVKEKVLKGKRPHLPDHCPSLLKALIERCWSQKPEARPSFAGICSELKYVKYLLMKGTNASSSTSLQLGFRNETKLSEVEEVRRASKLGELGFSTAEAAMAEPTSPGCSTWVQPGDLLGLKRQFVWLLNQNGGKMNLVKVPAQYNKHFGRPLYLAEYNVLKFIHLLEKMKDTLFVKGDGTTRMLHVVGKVRKFRPNNMYKNRASLPKSDKDRDSSEDSEFGIIKPKIAATGGGNKRLLLDIDRDDVKPVVNAQLPGWWDSVTDVKGKPDATTKNETVIDEVYNAEDYEEDVKLTNFIYELQELLVSYSCNFPLRTFEILYHQRYSRPLDLQSFGVDSLEALFQKVKDVAVLRERPGKGESQSEVFVVAL